jgi:hypothetical protein
VAPWKRNNLKPNPLDKNLAERSLAHDDEPTPITPRGQDGRSPPFVTPGGEPRSPGTTSGAVGASVPRAPSPEELLDQSSRPDPVRRQPVTPRLPFKLR